MRVYLIPGVGADSRLFKHFQLPDHQCVPLDWKPFGTAKSMTEYARVMAEEIDTSEPFAVLGVSMGGMIAMEIGKFLNPTLTILVSSSKNHHEFPGMLRLLSKTRLVYLGWGGLIKALSVNAKKQIGITNTEAHSELRQMTKEVSGSHLRKSVIAIMNWRNHDVLENVYHIHGTHDKVLPHKHANADYLVEGGSHLMIYDQAEEIALLVGKILKGELPKP